MKKFIIDNIKSNFLFKKKKMLSKYFSQLKNQLDNDLEIEVRFGTWKNKSFVSSVLPSYYHRLITYMLNSSFISQKEESTVHISGNIRKIITSDGSIFQIKKSCSIILSMKKSFNNNRFIYF